MNTCVLRLHYMRKQLDRVSGLDTGKHDCGIVLTASCASFQRFASDYGTSKHAVLGYMRGMFMELRYATNIPVRINAIALS